MPVLYIRDVPSKLYQRLKMRANRYHRSVTQETISILEEILGEPRTTELWKKIDLLREETFNRYGTFGDSSRLIREDRKR